MKIYLIRGARWAAALLLAAVLAACIDSGDGGSGDGNDGGNGVPEGPIGRDDGNGDGDGDGNVAPGSPLDIPQITQSQGLPVDDVRARLEADLAAQCGGELCVEVRVEPGQSDTLTRCEFETTDPPPGEQVARGGTVIVFTGVSPCDSPPPPLSPEPPPTSTP